MNHVRVLAARSIVLAAFAMVHGFVPFARGEASLMSFGVLAVCLGVIFAVSSRATPGAHRPFVGAMALSSGLVGVAAIVGASILGAHLLPWLILVFGVLTGVSEIAAGARSTNLPRTDHLALGGASLMLALVSLVGLGDATWYSGTLVAWAAIGAVLSGTASLQWKDHIRPSGAKETIS